MATLLMIPSMAHAQDTYQLYDTRLRDQQVTVNKVWDDEYSLDSAEYLRRREGHNVYKDFLRGKRESSIQNFLSVSISTKIPQAALRTYAIKMDANGGNFGTDSSGNAITDNTMTFNGKNLTIDGSYAMPQRQGYIFYGWSTIPNATSVDDENNANIACFDNEMDKIKSDWPDDLKRESIISKIGPNMFSKIINHHITSGEVHYAVPEYDKNWMTKLADKSTTTVYAVWKDCRVRYAVMMYGMYVDKDANGSTDTVTFGPALGGPEFAQYKADGKEDTSVTPTMSRHHEVSGDMTIMSEDADDCTDSSHSVITGTDAGADSSGNAYRCLHYDNWNTIVWWCKHDPHVYDKCMKKGCSKAITVTPTQTNIQNDIFSMTPDDSSTGDGNSFINHSSFDAANDYNNPQDFTKPKQGYAASLIRAQLVGADSHTNVGRVFAGVNAMQEYTSSSCVFACFPANLQHSIIAKDLSGVSTAQYTYDTISNDNIHDKLWLFSLYEMNSGGKTVYQDNSIKTSSGWESGDEHAGDFSGNSTRAFRQQDYEGILLRSPRNNEYIWTVSENGSIFHTYNRGWCNIAPGFCLPAAAQKS